MTRPARKTLDIRLTRRGRATFVLVLLAAIAVPSAARAAVAAVEPKTPSATPAGRDRLNVLILGDSLALCGFGKRLDERFRSDPRVNATFTYMACGTNPLSWLKQKPYTSIKAPCGYWSIESVDGAPAPAEMQDTYGMKLNQVPKPHPVPKLEDLIEHVRPDVLVVQTGSNLFGLFPDSKTVRPAQHGPALKKYLAPFVEKAVTPPSTLRKIYWVNPPVSGRVDMKVQEFLFEETRKQLSPAAMVIDSRKLVAYPYKHMDADKEHFLGEEMTQWADKVFELIEKDLNAQPLASLRPLSEMPGIAAAPNAPSEIPLRAEPLVSPTPVTIARAEPVATPEVIARAEPAPTPALEPIARAEPAARVENVPPAEPPQRAEPLLIKARLAFKSQPIPLQELLPYQESLVGYVYEIEKVLKGRYDERQILVMHPAHIALKEQRLDKYRVGKRYKLRLDRMEGTLWDTAKAKDESNLINLQPYMRFDDLKKHPGNRKD